MVVLLEPVLLLLLAVFALPDTLPPPPPPPPPPAMPKLKPPNTAPKAPAVTLSISAGAIVTGAALAGAHSPAAARAVSATALV